MRLDGNVHRRERNDAFFVRPGSDQEREWISFFSQVSPKWRHQFGWPSGLKKGIVKVTL